MIGIPIGLSLTGRDEALSEFVTPFMLASMLVLLISAPFPAASAFLHFRVPDPAALSSVSDFVRLRDGTLRAFDPAARQGTVSMPSFHTVLGVPFAYALRRVSVVAPLALLFNGWMVAPTPTPTQGGHYPVDVLSGLLVAFAGIVVLRYASGENLGVDRAASVARRRLAVAEPPAGGDMALARRDAHASGSNGDA
ncbi:phosphatase PAP2 family protein [Burkholderia oklahomensis]|nr:phosphatase PAP2 family protein [Burkholderia oklahomensis]MDN7676424.1 phosphatase PAP2 family protein [Burkholderia oklahomensis]